MHIQKSPSAAFTVIEMVIVVVILGILLTLAVPEVLDAKRTSKSAECGAALRQIETAKNHWRKDYPGASPSSDADLSQYFPGGTFPQDPWNANGFRNTHDLDQVATHIYNNIPAYEPNANCSLTNGYNDAYQKH